MKQYFRYFNKTDGHFWLAYQQNAKVTWLGPCEDWTAFHALVFSPNPQPPLTTSDLPKLEQLSATDYEVPIPEPCHHLAVGLNYSDHVEESKMKRPKEPLVFPRLCTLSKSVAEFSLTVGPWKLLDYEVEWAFVIKHDIDKHSLPETESAWDDAIAGVLLVLDTTWRDQQIKYARLGNQYFGFSASKSHPGCAATGPFFLSWQDFKKIPDFTIFLDLNGKRKQTGKLHQLLFPPRTIIRSIFSERSQSLRYYKDDDTDVSLLKTDKLKGGDIILTGTPAGILFVAPTKTKKVTAIISSFFAGRGNIIDSAKTKLINSQPPHLGLGDHIIASGSELGTIDIKIC